MNKSLEWLVKIKIMQFILVRETKHIKLENENGLEHFINIRVGDIVSIPFLNKTGIVNRANIYDLEVEVITPDNPYSSLYVNKLLIKKLSTNEAISSY